MIHPLEQITLEEISRAVELFKSWDDFDEKTLYSSLSLVEPEKKLLKNLSDNHDVPRVVKILGVDSVQDGGFEALIDLSKNKILEVKRISTAAQVQYSIGEIWEAMQLTTGSQEFQEVMAKRGITDMDSVSLDPWPGGGIRHESIPEGHRSIKTVAFIKENLSDNKYAKPVNGVIVHVDLTLKKVAHIEDHGVVPLPKQQARYSADYQTSLREQPKEIDITQPNGPGFTINGNLLSWEGWQLRISVTPFEGPVLHQISLNEREILHRASLSDMVVPYGSADPMQSWKAVHDGSEYGMGFLVKSLKLGCDCLGEIYYMDANFLLFDGTARTTESAVCIHEEDYGIQWKHNDDHGGENEVRRSRRLVISSFCTVGNYDYGLFWYLYLDGNIEFEAKLTGIVGVSSYDKRIHNQQQDLRVSEELVSPIHQHLFCIRLDWDIDGGKNQLLETNVETVPVGENNPNGTQFKAVSRHLKTESDAKRNISPFSSRTWKVINSNKRNSLGLPSGYKFIPGNTPVLLQQHDSPVAQRASFSKHNLWATPFKDNELFAAGPYTVMHNGEGGLDEITSSDRDIEECDLVTWHTFGVTHVPRPEDWPVMPVEYCGFLLMPVAFFEENPTINLPPSCKGKSKSNKTT